MLRSPPQLLELGAQLCRPGTDHKADRADSLLGLFVHAPASWQAHFHPAGNNLDNFFGTVKAFQAIAMFTVMHVLFHVTRLDRSISALRLYRDSAASMLFVAVLLLSSGRCNAVLLVLCIHTSFLLLQCCLMPFWAEQWKIQFCPRSWGILTRRDCKCSSTQAQRTAAICR